MHEVQPPGSGTPQPPTHPFAPLSDDAARATLAAAIRWALLITLLGALAIWISTNWHNAAMFAVGGTISAASLYEWLRLMRLLMDHQDQNKSGSGAGLVVAFFFLRLLFFAAAIYGSLKWIEGSVFALLAGLALAVVLLAWQALRLLRG